MPESNASTPQAPPKWWAASRTVWGALITALATLLPALGPVVGITVPPELVHELGEQVVILVQALAAVAGTALTIYGRLRAATPLERRSVVLKL